MLLALTDSFILEKSKFTEYELKVIKELALKKLRTQRKVKEQVAQRFQKRIFYLIENANVLSRFEKLGPNFINK